MLSVNTNILQTKRNAFGVGRTVLFNQLLSVILCRPQPILVLWNMRGKVIRYTLNVILLTMLL